MGDTIDAEAYKHWHPEYLDAKTMPYLKFIFRYRPRAILQAQGIIPAPAEDLDERTSDSADLETGISQTSSTNMHSQKDRSHSLNSVRGRKRARAADDDLGPRPKRRNEATSSQEGVHTGAPAAAEHGDAHTNDIKPMLGRPLQVQEWPASPEILNSQDMNTNTSEAEELVSLVRQLSGVQQQLEVIQSKIARFTGNVAGGSKPSLQAVKKEEKPRPGCLKVRDWEPEVVDLTLDD
ncbi:hypothetical protein SCP_0508930 [Sparassis crispa]|uniref:Uncharacterized protein n=1 Tax=Sparassis crispa TaxID=139825 RepID=A0A401GNQ2_9APHY|nr:hypothetical protein SCP_0508930 [Sparassis crispa]GBE83836.1 hypothetical protein SCP_0508930 [Sparassis crispa]